MTNRWGMGCCKSCKYCLQAINLFTGAPYSTGYIGNPTTPQYPIVAPSDSVCLKATANTPSLPFSTVYPGGTLWPGAYSPDNPLTGADAVYGIALKVISAVSKGGVACPSPPCGCAPLPPNLHLSVVTPDSFGFWQSTPLSYGPNPLGVPVLIPGFWSPGANPYGYWSPALAITPLLGAPFTGYYNVSCQGGSYAVSLYRTYADDLILPWDGSPWSGYTFFPPGTGGSTCSPLWLVSEPSTPPGGQVILTL